MRIVELAFSRNCLSKKLLFVRRYHLRLEFIHNEAEIRKTIRGRLTCPAAKSVDLQQRDITLAARSAIGKKSRWQ